MTLLPESPPGMRETLLDIQVAALPGSVPTRREEEGQSAEISTPLYPAQISASYHFCFLIFFLSFSTTGDVLIY